MTRQEALLAAAAEINELWRRCLEGRMGSDCPSNEIIAEIIERHLDNLNSAEAPHEPKQ